MCTVTMIRYVADPAAGSPGASPVIARIACNRDESPLRAPARPPLVRRRKKRRALLPVDPVSGGTWIAVNDAGLVFALLNLNDPSLPPRRTSETPSQSRGRIIPRLLDCTTLEAALERMAALEAASFAPFCVVATDGQRYFEVRSDTPARNASLQQLSLPVMFTSSGLGDEIARGFRAPLFEEYFGDGRASPAQQDEFHRHQWSDRPQWSVCMRRPGAQTVSWTTIELHPTRALMRYRELFPAVDSAIVERSLTLTQQVAQ